MIKELVSSDNPILYKDLYNENYRDSGYSDWNKIAKNLIDTMEYHKALGLAANQIGYDLPMFILSKKVCLFYQGLEYRAHNFHEVKIDTNNHLVFYAPEIILSPKTWTDKEGCLSFPGVLKNKTRSTSVLVKSQIQQTIDFGDNIGKFWPKLCINCFDLMAVVLQHEYDHLKGKTILDK